MTVTPSSRGAIWREIPAGVWALGLVSLLMDVSSEMIHALLPVYMVTVLGTSALTVGIIEGIAEATSSITKVFSGALSDWLGKRKFLAALGYGLAAFTKPIFPLAPSVGWLIAARFIDRVGKGVRGAPRDALVADISPGLGLGVVIWGLHMGFTQGLLATLIADTAPPELCGTAFGMFNLITGLALLIASVIAGAFWDVVGPQGTFLAGAAFTVLTLAGLFWLRARLGWQAQS